VGLPELAWQRREADGPRLVGLRTTPAGVLPPEGSQLVADGQIRGRVTSSRLSPALGRVVALAQVDAAYAEPGRELTVRLDGAESLRVVVTAGLAQVDPEGVRLRG